MCKAISLTNRDEIIWFSTSDIRKIVSTLLSALILTCVAFLQTKGSSGLFTAHYELIFMVLWTLKTEIVKNTNPHWNMALNINLRAWVLADAEWSRSQVSEIDSIRSFQSEESGYEW